MFIFESPLLIAVTLLLFLFAMVFGMLFGKIEGASENKTWNYRGAGVEISFVLFPFLLYSIAHIINGSFLKFLVSPELPMAAMIVSGIAMFSLLKGASASKGKLKTEGFLVLMLTFMAIFMCCAGLVFWLTLTQAPSKWFSVVNCLVILFAVAYSFAVTAAMSHVINSPEEVGIKS